MGAVAAVALIFVFIIGFMLLCIIAFSGDDFWQRNEWRVKSSKEINPGRFFCFLLFRFWLLLILFSLIYYLWRRYV